MFPSVQLKKATLVRLSKILSLSSYTSRNIAEKLIKNGKVKVNNQIITNNILIDIKSDIKVNDIKINVDITTKLWGIYKPLHVFCNTEKNYEYEEKKNMNIEKYKNKNIYKNNLINLNKNIENEKHSLLEYNNENNKALILNKNIHLNYLNKYENNKYNSINNLIEKKKKLNMNIYDFIRKKNILYEQKHKISNFIPEHLITINPLDSTSEGLILFTNDGCFANNLRNINNNILTTYLLKIQGELNYEKLNALKKKWKICNTDIQILQLDIIKSNHLSNWIKITYVENSKTYLNILFEKLNIKIRKCRRISFGTYKSSNFSQDFFMPLKIHSLFNHLIPKYDKNLTLIQPYGNITLDDNNKCLYVKNYLNNSLIQEK